MKNILFALCMLTVSLSVYAQHATVVYNYERNHFNENQPMPAETNLIFTGGAPAGVDAVEIAVYRARGKEERKPLFAAEWTRTNGSNTQVFNLPVNFQLHSGNEYDYKIVYYRTLSAAELEYLKVKLYQALDAYLTSSLEVGRNEITLLKSDKAILNDLNSIVESGLSIYKNKAHYQFMGFSDIVGEKIQQIQQANLKNGKFLFGKKNKEGRAMYANKLIKDLIKITHSETEQILNSGLLIPADTKAIDNYPTENGLNSLSLNAGYGGVYFDGNFDNLDYDTAPFLGISLPFGRKAFSPFWANASISLGVMLQNMENSLGQEVSGPIIGRPTYVGLGYKLFSFVRLNAGVAFTEEGSGNSNDLKDVNMQPFVGVSAEFNLAVSLGDK